MRLSALLGIVLIVIGGTFVLSAGFGPTGSEDKAVVRLYAGLGQIIVGLFFLFSHKLVGKKRV